MPFTPDVSAADAGRHRTRPAGRLIAILGAVVLSASLAAPAHAATVVPTPTRSLPAAYDAVPRYNEQRSCDPAAKPGVEAYAQMVLSTYRQGHSGGIVRGCGLGSTSEHKEGRAFDWMVSVNVPAEKAAGDALTTWLTGKDSHGVVGGNARRLGVMYVIWNRRIWSTYRIADGWRAYSGASSHTDHVHTSFTWDGAMKRTSWWDGTATVDDDTGPCRVYSGQPAAVYTGVRHTAACTTRLLAAPAAQYGIVWPGQSGSAVKVAQGKLGVTADGVFGSVTRGKLFTWQRTASVPVTGVLDKPTWAKMLVSSTTPTTPTTPVPTPPPPPAPVSRDLTGDGHADLLARVAATGQMRVYRGDGSRFSDPVMWGTGWNTLWGVEVGDLTGDGLTDVFGVDRESGVLFVYPGTGAGSVAERLSVGHGWNALRCITAAGDLDGDGHLDLVAIRNDGALVLYPGNGNGGVEPGRVIGGGWNGFDRLVGIGDLDRDGHDDLLARDLESGQLAIYHGSGKGGFRAGADVSGPGWNRMGALAAGGDLTGDGRPDLVAIEKATGRLWRYAGTSTGVTSGAVIGAGWNVADELG